MGRKSCFLSTKLKCYIHTLNIVVSTVDTSWLISFCIGKHPSTKFLKEGKKKDWRSLTLNQGRNSVECSKEAMQCMNACIWKITKKKKTMILGPGCIHSWQTLLELRWAVCHLSHSSGFLFSMQWWHPCFQQHQFDRAAVDKLWQELQGTNSQPALLFHTPQANMQDSQVLAHTAPARAPEQDWDSAQAVVRAGLKRGWTE